jgi:hypothetical protein
MPPLYSWGRRRAFHSRVMLWLWPHSAQNRRAHRYVASIDVNRSAFDERWNVKVCHRAAANAIQSVRTDLYFFSFERGASVSPSANAVGKENSQPPSSEITISARRAS